MFFFYQPFIYSTSRFELYHPCAQHTHAQAHARATYPAGHNHTCRRRESGLHMRLCVHCAKMNCDMGCLMHGLSQTHKDMFWEVTLLHLCMHAWKPCLKQATDRVLVCVGNQVECSPKIANNFNIWALKKYK